MNAELQSLIPLPDGSQPLPTKKPEAVVKPLIELQAAEENDDNTLLGNRFLCRGGGLLFVGSSGIGKSTAIMQSCICWSAGRECFGIKPAKPLKILIVQSENDEADLCEMRDGVLNGLNLSKGQAQLVADNVHIVFEGARTSAELIQGTIEPMLERFKPDLLVIDPALSYIGGNANEQETVGGFLRNLLNPVLQKHNCGVIIVHHTAKPNAARDSINRVATDFAYLGTGSAEWANWARAVLVLSAKDDSGLRQLRIGKRFRLGWQDAAGKPCVSRLLRQNAEGCGLYYTELSAEETMAIDGKLSAFEKVVRSDLLPEAGAEIQKDVLIARIAERKLCGENTARKQVVTLLISDGYVEEFEKPRSRARPEKWLRRTEKKFNCVSFVIPKTVTELVTDELQTTPAGICN
jgi:AAA domain